MQSESATLRSGRVESLAAVLFDGADASGFLQAQLSNDVGALDVGHAQISGYLNPKGRVLALATLARLDNHQFVAVVDAPIAAALIELLRRYVFRSRVEIALAPESVVAASDGSDSFPYAKSNRRISIEASPEDLDVIDAEWLALDVEAGIPRFSAATQGQFTAHALGLDRLDALSYTKGCYPGQEVVARTRHLGRGKRHPYLIEANAPLAPGDQVEGPRGAIGAIVMAAPTEKSWRAMAVLHESATSTELTHPTAGKTHIIRHY